MTELESARTLASLNAILNLTKYLGGGQRCYHPMFESSRNEPVP